LWRPFFHNSVYLASMKMTDYRAEERPRERLWEKGCGALTTAELLAILIRTGTQRKNAWEIARELLEECDGKLHRLLGMDVWRISRLEGIGKAKAATIAAALELGRRAAEEKVETGTVMEDPRLVYDMMLPRLKGLDHEQCWVLLLDKNLRCLVKEKITSGGGSSTTIDTSQIARIALDRQANGIILVHNHPCGDSTPSKSDIEETRKLKNALLPFNISLVDHVIVSAGEYFSFSEDCVFHADGAKLF